MMVLSHFFFCFFPVYWYTSIITSGRFSSMSFKALKNCWAASCLTDQLFLKNDCAKHLHVQGCSLPRKVVMSNQPWFIRPAVICALHYIECMTQGFIHPSVKLHQGSFRPIFLLALILKMFLYS